MTNNLSTPNATPGLVGGAISCVCAVLAFFIPLIGLALSVVGLVLGIKAYKTGKAHNYQPALLSGLIGSLISGISLAVGLLGLLAIVGMAGGMGLGLGLL